MAETKRYTIAAGTEIPFHNNADFCVGTGRMGLALQKEYFDQLKFVQEKVGFQHIRGHGLFCDDMAIYHEYQDEDGNTQVEYNFTYLDLVMDSYRSVGLRPFLELGFMPEKMASGDQTVFYWKGNVTPPKDYAAWTALVQATLKHLMDRYGGDDVVTWPIEVWNEPNLKGFWKDADMQEYFRLFQRTFLAVKELDGRFRVGGPAVCGGTDRQWVRGFLDFCRENHLALDFITRHFYTSKPPELKGHYDYVQLTDPWESLKELKATRDIIDSFEVYKGLPIHVTEFNTSYTPKAPVHDTNENAAYVATLLSKLGDCNESYSYWTFGDIFEEQGVPFTPFHGGFGLVANGLIAKPTLWTFQFYKKLQGAEACVHRSEDAVVMRTRDGGYRGIAWNLVMEKKGERKMHLSFELPVKQEGEFSLLTETVDETCCNPLKLWHDMGEPCSLNRDQLSVLRAGSSPFIETKRFAAEKKVISVSLDLKENAVVYFEIKPTKKVGDRGFCYERAVRTE